jgi:photosystem II stability/assembly factor-like uncharacterized protein
LAILVLDSEDSPTILDDSLFSILLGHYLMDANIVSRRLNIMMKSLTPLVVLIFLASGILSGCNMFAKTETPPGKAAPIPTQTPTEVPAAWEIVHKFKVESNIYFVGFNDEEYGITVGYGGAVATTQDGGSTWEKANNNSWCRFGLDIVDESIAWHIGNRGQVGVSTDGGRNWQRASDLSDQGISKSIRFLDEQTGWAASEKQLWATSDGGQTWEDVPLPEAGITILAIEMLSKVNGFILVHPGILYATHDGGATWISLDLGLGEDQISLLALPSMRFFDAQNGLIVTKVGGKGVVALHTSNEGAAWEQEDLPVELETSNPTFYLSADGATLTINDNLVVVLRRNR